MLPEPFYCDEFTVIYNDDCRRLLPLLDFDAIVSDPPYGMDYQHGARKGGKLLGVDGHAIQGDTEAFDPAHLLAHRKPTILWGGNHFGDALPASRGWLVWDKRDGRPSNDQSDVELAWTNCLTTARAHSRYWNGATRTGREQAEGRLHVNQKPVALMSWCLGFIPNAHVIVDPYMGSGSTLIAARERGLRCIGIEVDAAHCQKAVGRLAQGALDFGEPA